MVQRVLVNIDENDIERLINKLKDIINSKYRKENIRVKLVVGKQFNTYHIFENGYETELRIAFLGDTLIVSRVLFRIRRKGIMSSCYRVLKSFCKENGIKRVVIQSVLTKEMAMWCKKNKFIPNEYCMEVEGILVGDYIKNIGVLVND